MQSVVSTTVRAAALVLVLSLFGLSYAIQRIYTPEEAKVKEQLQQESQKRQNEKLKTTAAPENIVYTVKEIRFLGNRVLPTKTLVSGIPDFFTPPSTQFVTGAQQNTYNLMPIRAIIENPGHPQPVSAKTIQGFTQYLVSVYRNNGYAGIYIYVPADAVKDGNSLKDNVLPIMIIEGVVSDVSVESFDSKQKTTEKSYLRKDVVEKWSPVKPGQIVDQKALNDYVNLLNENPDRYVSAVVSKGAEPNSLALKYNLYEADPWHYFAQIDNSGVPETRYTPRIGIINTNALGFDDVFSVVYQARPDSTWDEVYSVYGSYEFPLFTPRLRLKLYGGYSQFDVTQSNGDIGFLGNGSFYGGKLTYNLFQYDKWFFDLTGSLSSEKSNSTPSVFPEFLTSNLTMDLVGYGFDIHRLTDMTDTSFTVERVQNIGGSSQEEFSLARPGAAKDFAFDTFGVTHSQYFDPNKIDRITGLVRYILPEERLAPPKMTPFGGMYTVRGYKELEIIADGGVLASAQYEYDLVRRYQIEHKDQSKSWLRKLAPAAFVDYGLATIEDPQPGEKKNQALVSVGVGLIAELGDHITGTIYYGIPLKSTTETDSGDGRINVGLLARW